MLLFVVIGLATIASATSESAKCPERCRPTCKVPNPQDCSDYTDCNNCESGYIWDENQKKCVQIGACPYGQSCNGDPNASIRESPPPCPSTCEAPEELPCKKMGLAVGCVCNSDYVLSDVDGTCVELDKCPGGNPCGVNGTLGCKYDCPSKFCPVQEKQSLIFCNPQQPCPTGCVCKWRYIWRSEDDRTCIKSQDCPEIPCTGENEEWNRCPSPCFGDSCSEYYLRDAACNTFVEAECYPQCQCKYGFAREKSQGCIPGDQCPQDPQSES